MIQTILLLIALICIVRIFPYNKNKSIQTETADRFSIEFYPITKRYYPKYGDLYLKLKRSTGIVEGIKDYLFEYADHFKTEEECLPIINLFKEHHLKVNVKAIEVKL